MGSIIDLYARSFGFKRKSTVEVEVITDEGGFGRAMVPSGASTGF